MRAITRHVPRKYRTIIFRVAVGLACFALLCLLTSNKQTATSGPGRSDEALFRFDYDSEKPKDHVDNYEEEEHEQAVAPAQHRVNGKDALEEEELNSKGFGEEPVLSPEVYEYFTEEELKPLFEKPPSDPSSPGEMGKPVRITDTSEETKRKIKEGWDKHAFNHYVCDKISLHRTIGDKRDRECKERKWRKPLPTTSVIIIFHNEAWCALLRTVHSVLESSPKVALEEIILVDDASTFEDLGQKLDDYVKPLEIVKIIRLPERAGLIRARLAGAEAATGNVLTFLDSHCECAPHWLEPLLERIAEDPTRVVCPVIEVINSDNFAMSLTAARHVPLGAFGWGLEFRWATQPGNKGMEIQTKSRDEPFTTPVMAGAAFSMQKEYFYHLGGYDVEMNGTGSENIELSFRTWMCGGSLEINPCSRVGHVGRKRKPHALREEQEARVRNKMRVAETWMKDYKWMFYRRTPLARKLDVPDVSDRWLLIDQLQCGNFQWYLTDVYPDLYVVQHKDIVLHGEITCSVNQDYCLDSNNIHGNPGSVIDVDKCAGLGKGQYFEVTEQGEIRQNTISELCLAAHGHEVWTEKCYYPWREVPASQKWIILPDGHIYHSSSNLCLTANLHRLSATLMKCVKQGTSQIWKVGQKDGYEEEHVEEVFEIGMIEGEENSTVATEEGNQGKAEGMVDIKTTEVAEEKVEMKTEKDNADIQSDVVIEQTPSEELNQT